MKKIFRVLLVLLAAVSTLKLYAQDPNFSQFYLKEVYYNPAFIGINPGLRGTVTDRHLWTSVPGEWGTQSIAFDFYDTKFAEGGVAAHLMRNSQGENYLNTFLGGVGYAKQIRILPDLMMQLGAGAQYVFKTLNYSKLTFVDEFDARFGRIYETEFQPSEEGWWSQGFLDYNAGMVVKFNIRKTPVKYLASNTVGIAFHHLSQPDMSWLDDGNEAPLPLKMNIHAHTMLRFDRSGFHNRYFLITPGFLFENQLAARDWFKGTEAGAKTISFGTNALIPSRVSFMSSLYVGLWARKAFIKKEALKEDLSKIKNASFDSMIFTVGYNKNSRDQKSLYQIVYSYDMTISSAGVTTGGTHEITLSFEIHNLKLPGRDGRRSAVPHPNDKFFK